MRRGVPVTCTTAKFQVGTAFLVSYQLGEMYSCGPWKTTVTGPLIAAFCGLALARCHQILPHPSFERSSTVGTFVILTEGCAVTSIANAYSSMKSSRNGRS